MKCYVKKKSFIFSTTVFILTYNICYTMENLQNQISNGNANNDVITVANNQAPAPLSQNIINIDNNQYLNPSTINIYTDCNVLRNYVIRNHNKLINPKELSPRDIWDKYSNLRDILTIRPYDDTIIYDKEKNQYISDSNYLVSNYYKFFKKKYNDTILEKLANNLLCDYVAFLCHYSKRNYLLFNMAWSIIFHYTKICSNNAQLRMTLLHLKKEFIGSIGYLYDIENNLLEYVKGNVK